LSKKTLNKKITVKYINRKLLEIDTSKMYIINMIITKCILVNDKELM